MRYHFKKNMREIKTKLQIIKDGEVSNINIYEEERHWSEKLIMFFNSIYTTFKNTESLKYYLKEWENKKNYHLLTKDEIENLKVLDLSYLYLIEIPKEIGYLQNLEILNLSGNKLKELPDEIYGLGNLKELNLGNIIYGGNDIRYISKNIDRLTKLESLHLIWNDNLTSLPQEILSLENLMYISLSQRVILKTDIGKELAQTVCVNFEDFYN